MQVQIVGSTPGRRTAGQRPWASRSQTRARAHARTHTHTCPPPLKFDIRRYRNSINSTYKNKTDLGHLLIELLTRDTRQQQLTNSCEMIAIYELVYAVTPRTRARHATVPASRNRLSPRRPVNYLPQPYVAQW